MHTWHTISIPFSELKEHTLTEVSAGPKRVGVLRKGDDVYAFAALCPHAGVPLCEGWLDAAGRIVCPQHKYKFDPVNGRNTTGEGYKLFTYPVRIEGEEIKIGLLEAQ